MCKDMPVSVKVYYGGPSSAIEIRRFIFRPESSRHGSGIYNDFIRSLSALFNGLNLRDVHLCWKDDDGDYVVFSSDDELRVAITNTTDNTLRIYVREKELPVRVVGASGSTNSGTSGHNATGASVALATASNSNRRSADQERYHRHHCHTGRGRRSGRSDLSPRDRPDATPTNAVRWPTAVVDNLAKDMTDHLHLDGEVLTVAVDHSSSPNEATANHVGERQGRTTLNDDHARDPSADATVSLATAAAATATGATGCAGVVCSECRGEGRGVWYRCTVCNDFYLCSECENRGLHDQHIMVRISSASAARQGAPQQLYHR